MSFHPLKKILLASAMTLSFAFNTEAQAQDTPPLPQQPQVALTSSDDPAYTVHRQYNEDGKLVSITRYKDGQLNDGPNGEAAVQNFSDNGALTYAWHYKAGLLHDGLNGEAAVQSYSEGGMLLYAWHYKNGKLHDGLNGEAAVQSFGENGMLAYRAHYKNGKLNDGVNGEVAVQKFDSKGKMTYAARYKDGALVKELSRRERDAYQKKSQKPAKKVKVPKAPY